MWNPLRRLTESDKSRLRRLERIVDDLAADVTLTSERLVKLDARLRARARRQLLEADAEPEPGGAPPGVELPSVDVPDGTVELNGDRSQVRERLRSLARAKFGGRQ